MVNGGTTSYNKPGTSNIERLQQPTTGTTKQKQLLRSIY